MYLEKDDGDLTSFASRLSCLICSTFASSYSSGSDSNRGVNLIFALIGDGIGGARVTMESSILTNESTFHCMVALSLIVLDQILMTS